MSGDYTALSRTEWLDLGARFYQRLDGRLAALSAQQWQRTTPYLGWRAKDVLAHMTSAMPVNFRQVLARALAGNPAAPVEFDTLARNAREVARLQVEPADKLLEMFRTELAGILAVYRRCTDEQWLSPAWFFIGPVNVRGLFLAQLADNVLHERDLLLINGWWNGIDPEYGRPLVDWFLRELRVASFRPDRAAGLHASILYRLAGPSGGEWTMTIDQGRCEMIRGGTSHSDLIVDSDVEDLVVAGMARASPVVGSMARVFDWIRGPARAEQVVAAITGSASLATALASGRIRVTGDRRLFSRINQAFWHFWQRTEQTGANIAANA